MTTWSDWERVARFDTEETIYEKKYRDRGGGVARVLFNRPQRLNAFTGTGAAEFVRAIHDANRDDEIGVIVVSGVGDHFGTGGDVQWEAAGGLRGHIPDFDAAVRNCLKPTIAAVKGYCIGGHHHLAYHCDLTIAADTAIFGQNGPRVGSPVHGRSVAQLAHVIGIKRAKEFWMLCRQYTAQQAYEMGLVNAVVLLDRLETEVDQWCDELLNLAPTCLALIKQSFEAVGGCLTQESGRVLAMIAPDFHDRPEVAEAQRAWSERRPPDFWARWREQRSGDSERRP
jgi:naphthoate synthase/2-ketocyclohexanecarboxyl-CoA hydrolase